MDEFLEARAMMAQHLDLLMEHLSIRRQATKIDADDLFQSSGESESNFNWNPNFSPLSNFEILTQEKNSLGIYVSGNPLKNYEVIETWLRENLMIEDIHIILINKVKKIFTKTNMMMFALEITTTKAELEGVIFPKLAPEYSPILEEKNIYFVIGKISQKKSKKSEVVKSVDEINEDMEIGNDSETEIAIETESTQAEEIKEYDELPKLLINSLAKFEDGVINMIQKNETLSFSRIKLIENFDWLKLKQNPLSFEEYFNTQTHKNSQKKQENKTETPAQIKDSIPKSKLEQKTDSIAQLKLPKKLGSEFLSLVQSKISKHEKQGYKEVELWIEVNGEFKKVKGKLWLDSDLINTIRNSV
jgi:DNA polymerase III alpha subunit